MDLNIVMHVKGEIGLWNSWSEAYLYLLWSHGCTFFCFLEDGRQHLELVVYFEVLLNLIVFWILISCGVVSRYKRFGGTLCLDLQVRSHFDSDLEILISSELLESRLHYVTMQKNRMWKFTAVENPQLITTKGLIKLHKSSLYKTKI